MDIKEIDELSRNLPFFEKHTHPLTERDEEKFM
jgi:hypothetical protein